MKKIDINLTQSVRERAILDVVDEPKLVMEEQEKSGYICQANAMNPLIPGEGDKDVLLTLLEEFAKEKIDECAK
jgi:uncharacterized protein YfeS